MIVNLSLSVGFLVGAFASIIVNYDELIKTLGEIFGV